MTVKVRQFTYAAEELVEAIEYMKNDIEYLERQLSKYIDNPFVFEGVSKNIEYDKKLLEELEQAQA